MIRLRKSPVVFNEEEHTYWLGDKQLRGITSTLIKRAFPDKYSGIPESVLANAARKGHELHAQIEFHDNFRTEPENIRIANYERLKEENGLKVVANEYLVSDEQRYASSIDIVMQNIAEEVCITDTKTTWNLDKASVMGLGLPSTFIKACEDRGVLHRRKDGEKRNCAVYFSRRELQKCVVESKVLDMASDYTLT